MAPRIWQTWLPPEIARIAVEEEPRRFAALSRCVCAEVDGALRDEADPNRWHRLVKWISHVNTFNSLQSDFAAEDVRPLAEALWRAVAEAWRDLEAQVRLSECLTLLLRTHKRTLRQARLVLPWRPVFDTVMRLYGTPQPKLEGVGLIVARSTALVKLVTKARRYFEPAALGEVWSELRPAVEAVGVRPSEGYEALGYLQLFAPTHNICSCPWSAVNAWVAQWMAAWDLAANSPSWDSLWLGLVARAAKHDWRGAGAWRPHLPALFVTVTGLFDVPVGSSPSLGAADLVERAAPGRAAVMFGDQMGYGAFHAARLVVALLRCTTGIDPRVGPTAATAAAAATHLERLTALLEQYYHPSNTGKWCRELSTLLKHLVKAAVKQLERQQPPQPQQQTEGMADCDDYDDEYEFTNVTGDDADTSGVGAGTVAAATNIASGTGSGSGSTAGARPWVSELREPELQRLARCCVKLASRGQFSKDSGLANVSIKALSQLALLAPSLVLPLVTDRFRTAVATATATHQLVAASATLALCARPLLLAGWGGVRQEGLGWGREREAAAAAGDVEAEAVAVEAMGEEGEGECAAQLVSEALMAALPGLDANDEPKTNAVLQLYVSVLSALPRLRGAGEDAETEDEKAAADEEEEHTFARASLPPPLSSAPSSMDVDSTSAPQGAGGNGDNGNGAGCGGLSLSLYVEEWAEEVLERCLALLQNLDSGPAHRGTDLAAGGGGQGGGGGGSTSSFLVAPRSMFGPLWQLLMHHTRPAVRRKLVRRLASFVLSGSTPGVAAEAAMIASQAASAAPKEAVRSLVLPLLARVEAEVEELPRLDLARGGEGPAPHPPSAGQEAALRFHLSTLNDVLSQLHADVLTHPDLGAALRGATPPSAAEVAAEGAAGGVPALPPRSLLSRVLALADRLAGVNSAAVQREAGSLAGAAVMILARFWMEPHLPWRRRDGATAVPLVAGRGTGVEVWADKFGTGYRPQRWCSPTPAQVALARALVSELLLAPTRRLRELVAAGEVGAGAKVRMRAELSQIRGFLTSSLSMLRDFGFGGGSSGPLEGLPPAVPLAVGGSLGARLGGEGTREEVAEVLVAVCSSLRASSSDPELLDLATRCCGLLLAAGSVEWVAAGAEERHQRASRHMHTDTPAAARLMPGLPWRRRSPMWLVQARLFNTLLSRAGSAAFRSEDWSSTRQPTLTSLEQFPPAYLSLVRTLCQLAQHPSAQLARNAAAAVDTAVKRFPVLAPAYLPYFLATLANVPYNGTTTTAAAVFPDAAFFARLRDAALVGAEPLQALAQEIAAEAAEAPAASSPSSSASGGPVSEIERDGRVLGSCHALNSTLTFWRLISRDLTWMAATLHALLAARAHNASVPQKALGDLLLAFAGRVLHPPGMSYDSPPYTVLAQQLAEAARPGVMTRQLGGTFRYTVIANVMLAMLLPHRYESGPALGLPYSGSGGSGSAEGEEDSAVEVASLYLRHMMGLLLAAEAPQLRQLGLSGTFIPLSAVLEFGQPMPQLLEVVRQAAAGTGAGGGGEGGDGWGERLVRSLVLNHSELDNAEAMKDKRGAGLLALHQRLLNSTFEELAGGLAGVPVDRLARWPSDGHAAPPAVAEGRFEVKHARLVQLLAAAAPEEVLAALRARLESLTAPDRLSAPTNSSDKAELATAAEALAGIIASGAPWAVRQQAYGSAAGGDVSGDVSSGGGDREEHWALAALGRALRHTNLDMSDSWALSYRFALRGLLDGLVPERLHLAAPPAPARGLAPRPPVVAGLPRPVLAAAMGELLGMVAPAAATVAQRGPAAAVNAAAAAAATTGLGDSEAGAGVGGEVELVGGGGGGGGVPQQLKRLRVLGAAVREVAGLNPRRGELPGQVRAFWSAVLDFLRSLLSSPDCLSLREALQSPVADTLGYLGGAEGLVGVLPQQGASRKRNGDGNGNGNGDNDLVHVSAEPSGMSTPAEIELGDGDEAVLLLPRQAQPHPHPPAPSLDLLRSRARRLALLLASSFNAAAVRVNEAAKGTTATLTTSTAAAQQPPAAATGEPVVPTAAVLPPRRSSGGGDGGDNSIGGDSPASRATTATSAGDTDVVLVEPPPEVASVPGSAGTSPPAVAAAVAATTTATSSTRSMEVEGAAGVAGGGNGGDEGNGERGGPVPSLAAAVSRLGLGLEVLLLAAGRHRAPGLRELVVGMLPGLLRLQDVAGPDLRKFHRELRVALMVVRCVSLNSHSGSPNPEPLAPLPPASGPAMVEAALEAVAAAAVVEVPWSARGAALSYAQALWFRHAPLMTVEQMKRLQDVVVALLPDPKADVRTLAAATLSGLLRATPPWEGEALRNHLLRRAENLFGGASGRSRGSGRGGNRAAGTVAAAPAAPTLPLQPKSSSAAAQPPASQPQLSPQQQLQLAKMGCVAGLSALLMSYPYDVPYWVPPVLLALVCAAGGAERDGAVRGEAGRALGEFRRTHESEALEELRARMRPDDWDAFSQATGTASYFV